MSRDSHGTDLFLAAAIPPGSLPFPERLPPLPPKVERYRRQTPRPRESGAASTRPKSAVRCQPATMACTATGSPESSPGYWGLAPAANATDHWYRWSAREGGDLDDIDHTFATLQTEAIRHYFWHVPFGAKALAYAQRAGRLVLHDRIAGRIRSRIGASEPFRDGMQTPTRADRADALDYALHAIAACCRTCASYWHGLTKGPPTNRTGNSLPELNSPVVT